MVTDWASSDPLHFKRAGTGTTALSGIDLAPPRDPKTGPEHFNQPETFDRLEKYGPNRPANCRQLP